MDVQFIDLDSIQADPKNHRKTFNEESIQELATNIENFGLQQPIRVRKVSCDTYQIIMGERRYRAFKLLEKDSIPCIVEKNEDTELVVRLKSASENLLRENVNPIEEALGYVHILNEHGLSIKDLSERLGVSKDRISTIKRLLDCDKETQLALSQEKITIGHCKQLLRLKDKEKERLLLKQILEADLSVSELKNLIDCESSIDTLDNPSPTNSDNTLSNNFDNANSELSNDDVTLQNSRDIDIKQVFTQFWESVNILLNIDIAEIDTTQRKKAIPLLKKLVKTLGDK